MKISGVARIFNDKKKQEELQQVTNELIGDKIYHHFHFKAQGQLT